MLCFVHGYGLTGSGSNQWCNSMARGLVEIGETVHLVCQEQRPEEIGFVTSAFLYDEEGIPTEQFRRDVPFRGQCILHRPVLRRLPTYVRPQASNTYMASILDLPDAEIQEYLARNERTLRRVLADNEIRAVHVNHVVLMAVAVHRVCRAMGIPFGVMPHGSAIEYVVKHDSRMHRLAADALQDADRIFTLSAEMRARIQEVFPDVAGASDKMVMASAGVDTRQFQMVDRSARRASIDELKTRLSGTERGKTAAQRQLLRQAVDSDLDLPALRAVIERSEDYPPRRPDEAVEEVLDRVDWERDDVMLYVGKLIAAKGLPSLIAAFPCIAERHPRARLIVAGRGNLRGGLEVLVEALRTGRRELVEKIATWGSALEGEPPSPFDRVVEFFRTLDTPARRDAYFAAAREYCTPDRVLFTGYLDHDLLCRLFPCCDVAIFPSVVKEAAPLVVPEAMASGCFPIGTDYAGMATSLDAAAEAVPGDVARLMRLRPDPRHTMHDLIEHVPRALVVAPRYRESLRDVAVRRFDWRSVAADLAGKMTEMGSRRDQAGWNPNWREASSR